MLATDGPIWDALRAQAPDKVALIESLVKEAAALLGQVRDTFPTYTLHEGQHAENVLRLMSDLLGPEASRLTGLEAAMLILSAYFHDIGMVYRPEERERLRGSEELSKFLESRPEAYLAVQRNTGVAPDDVLLDFCRAHHGEHAQALLNGMSDKLRWGIMPLAPTLAALCASHSLPASHLKDDAFRVDFLGTCDLRLCGILLRLADILDFDASRSPRAVYEHMRLAEHASSQVAISDAEWRKHLRRDLVIAVPFELHSALQLSVRRAMLAWADGDFTSYAERFAAISLISVAPNQADRLISALNDDSVLADNGWSLEKVIPAIELDSSGRRKAAEPDHYSAIELRAKSSQETIELLLEIFPGRPWFKPTGYGVGEGPNFYQFLTSTLVQMHLDVAIYFSEEETGNDRRRKQRLIVGSASVPDLPRGLGYFRPLFFVPYRDDLVTLKDPASTSVNASHPLAQWLIGRAEPLDREAPVLLARLTDALEAAPSETNTNEANRLLDDLRVAFPKLVLADELHIRFEAGQWK